MKKYGDGIVGFGWVAGAHMTTFMPPANFKPVADMSRRALDPTEIEKPIALDFESACGMLDAVEKTK
jgi:hypothetical protein